MSTQQNHVARQIVEQCEHDPPERGEPHPKLFSDLDDDGLSETLFILWQKGCLEAVWDESEQETKWGLTEFGAELCDRGLVRPYVHATEEDSQIQAEPSVLRNITHD